MASLRLGGFETLGDPSYQGQICLYGCAITMQRADGTQYGANGTPKSTSWIAPDQLQLVFDTATLVVTYSQPSSTTMALNFEVQDTSPDAIASIGGTAFVLDFPTVPTGINDYGKSKLAQYPHMLDPTRGVPALSVPFGKYGTTLFSLLSDAAQAAAQGATLGNLNQFNSAQRFNFNWQFAKPIASGTTASITLGVSNLPGSQPFASIAGAAAQNYAGDFPQSAGVWRNRGALARWFLTGPTPHCANGLNPRGWFNNDCSIDVTTTAGLDNFRSRMLEWTDTVISNLRWMKAQGVVIWDIEGQQETQPVSYVCAPDMLDQVAPEMDYVGSGNTLGVADQMVANIQKAGFEVGLCLRPQRYTQVKGRWQQPDQPDPGTVIAQKAAYALQRWGIKVFYVDSNVHPVFGWPIPADMDFGPALAANPNTLFIPEWFDPRHSGNTAPYPGTLAPGATGSPDAPRAEYPGSFGIVLPDDDTAKSNTSKFVSAVAQGDIMMPPAWYRPPSATVTAQVYRTVGLRPDVALTSPPAHAKVNAGTPITLTASVTAGDGTPTRVEFYTGGTLIGTSTAAPWTYRWQGAASITHSLVAKVYDTKGNSSVSAAVPLTVQAP